MSYLDPTVRNIPPPIKKDHFYTVEQIISRLDLIATAVDKLRVRGNSYLNYTKVAERLARIHQAIEDLKNSTRSVISLLDQVKNGSFAREAVISINKINFYNDSLLKMESLLGSIMEKSRVLENALNSSVDIEVVRMEAFKMRNKLGTLFSELKDLSHHLISLTTYRE